MNCPTCGGKTFGKANCVICKKAFIKRREDQVTCASLKCRRARQIQQQKAWRKENAHEYRAATRFRGEYIICKVCKKKVQKIRSNQATCLSKGCQYAIRTIYKYRDIEAEHVRDLG